MLRRFIVYLSLVLAIFLPWIAWETDRNMVRRWVYPVKGHLAAWSTKCDSTAPDWLKQLTESLAQSHDSPANQLVWLRSDGIQIGCVNGWYNWPYVSERVTSETPFRLASLSKIVSFIGLTHGNASQVGEWLAEPVVKWLSLTGPLADERVSRISIEQLLNHSAGFDRLASPDPMAIRNHKPWCPYEPATLENIKLDFTPGTRYAYSNLGYCLAEVAYANRWGRSLRAALQNDLHINRYGIRYLEFDDSPVNFNFMNHGFYDSNFISYFDWFALAGSMGMVASASGLAAFIQDNRPALALSQSMHERTVPCVEKQHHDCMDGFLERQQINGKVIWSQGGYLFGMTSLFLLDSTGNVLVWLGAGDSKSPRATKNYITQSFVKEFR